jgi:shikimate dehydrogenase
VKQVGLIGYPVEHSLSPAMHNAAFEACGLDYRYVLLPTPPEQLEERIRSCVEGGFAGWNVTVPHKQAMVGFLDEMSDEVRATGACNTVRVEGGRLVGFNTDIEGFMSGLDEAGGIEPGSKAVMLGAGGAARGVAFALARAGHHVTVVSRRLEQAAELATFLRKEGIKISSSSLQGSAPVSETGDANLLVNCTPAGMWPDVESSPLPDSVTLHDGLLVYDLVYKPRPTRLLREASARGCRTQDGLAMLVNQGAAAFKIWTGQNAPVGLMRDAVRTIQSSDKR